VTCITFSFERPEQCLNVIAAQTALLNDQQTGVTFRMEQMVAAVQLIKALGSAWECPRN
jgi:outer membrane protein TolC